MKDALKILMLEDSSIDAELVQQSLLRKKPGCIFKLVMNREDFLDGLDQFEPDLILSDNTLPQFNATEALELFKQRSLPIPFILVTGTVSEEFAAGVIKAGADDYILKDRLTRLPGAIDAALQKKKAEAAIHQSEETRRLIMNASLDAIICIDKAGLITVWNIQAEKMFGWKETEVIGKNLADFIIPAQYRNNAAHGFSHYDITGEERVLNKVTELQATGRNGKEFPIELAIVPIKQHTSDFYCAFIRDITERKKSEDKIKFNADLLSTVGQAVIATNTAGVIIYWNNAAEKIYGWAAEETIGKQITDITPTQQNREEALLIMEELSKGNFWSGEFEVQRKDGTVFPAFVTTSPVQDHQGNLTAIIGVSADMTEMKKTEETLKLMERKMLNQKIQEQKKISRAIIKAQEEEKNYIGKELHDNISQILASTKMFLSSAAKKNESIREIIKYPIELINSSIDEIRLLSHKQVTPLKNINLEEMLQNLVSTLDKNSALHIDFNYAVNAGLLSDELKLNIYRIVQEQINNIIKHAQANNVTIAVRTEGNNISVNVTDDGKGFKLNEKRKGIGISNMMNRIESYNGKMQIKTSPGNGTRIKVTIPVSEAVFSIKD
jgi:PAS domain S-box-containing protein